MPALILHLSDLHIRGEQDSILQKRRHISSTLNASLPNTSAVVIAVSGDISQSGQVEEYDVAHRFLTNLVEDIKNEKDIPIEVVLTPGNHDCDLSGNLAVRTAVLKDVKNHIGNMPSQLIEETTRVQSNFLDFKRKLISANSLILDDPL